MLPSLLAVETVTIIEPVMVEDRGTTLPDWTQQPASTVNVEGCSVQPGASSEDLDGRQNVEIRYTVWMPPGTAVTAHSRVIVRDEPYSVDGEPARWDDPLNALSHVRVSLVDWHG